jgi:hypothetical protein
MDSAFALCINGANRHIWLLNVVCMVATLTSDVTHMPIVTIVLVYNYRRINRTGVGCTKVG